jgi:hypothetical protein
MIRCPIGSPACCAVRSWSFGPMTSPVSSGPVTSVSRCGRTIGACDGARSPVLLYPGESSGGWVPGGAGR